MRSASPADDATEVTAGQVREVVARIIAAGRLHEVTQVAAPILYSSLTGLRARQPVRAASARLITDAPHGVSFQAGAAR